MSDEAGTRTSDLQARRARTLAGVGLGVAIGIVCPPAAVILGLFGFLKSARKVAQNPNDNDAMMDMVLGYGDVVGGQSKSSGK